MFIDQGQSGVARPGGVLCAGLDLTQMSLEQNIAPRRGAEKNKLPYYRHVPHPEVIC